MTKSDASPSTGLFDFLAWLEVNKQKLAVGFVVALIVGFAIYVVKWRSGERETAASEALLALRVPAGNTNTPPPSASAYLEVASKYPNTDAAERAVLLAAGAYFVEGKYAEAQTQFEKFLRDHPDHPLSATAAYGIASSLEAQGKADEAQAAYQNLLTRYPKAAEVDHAKMAIARIAEAKNQPAQALKIYEELSNPAAPSPVRSEALARKNALLAQHPELAPAASSGTATNGNVPTAK